MRTYRVGLLYFQETFTRELEFRLKKVGPLKDRDGIETWIRAEHIPIHEFSIDLQCSYDLIIDRASHYFRLGIPMFMMMAHQGTHIINNPFSFHYFINRKDVGYHIAQELGIPIPPTYVLPVYETPFFKKEDFVHHRHFEWEIIAEKIGFPCILKPANGRGARGVKFCKDLDSLLESYHHSGTEIMVAQTIVDSPYEWQIRCLCMGKEILISKYIFREFDQSEYLEDENFLEPDLKKLIEEYSYVINRAMGYEMNSVEFFIDHEGIPWAIDFNNPIPDGRLEALGPHWYEKYLQAMVQMVIRFAMDPADPDFIPDVNPYSRIARLSIPKEERFQKALEIASPYYRQDDQS
jgi:hypothetical protein